MHDFTIPMQDFSPAFQKLKLLQEVYRVHSSSMAMTSKVVSGGTAPNNVYIIDYRYHLVYCILMRIRHMLHNYVPKKTYKLTFHLPGEDFVIYEDCHHRILLGGDRLTVCRTRGTQLARSHADESSESLEGFIPVTEDWHARMTIV